MRVSAKRRDKSVLRRLKWVARNHRETALCMVFPQRSGGLQAGDPLLLASCPTLPRVTSSELTTLLRTMDAAALTELVAARPDAAAAPEPRSLGELALRLGTPHSVHAALERLPAPALALVDVLAALGDGVARCELDALLGLDRPDRIDPLLARLRSLALAWQDETTLRVPAPVSAVFEHPLALGAPAATLLGQLTVEQLTTIAGEHGITKQRRKAEWVAALTGVLTDPQQVRAVLSAAPPELGESIQILAWAEPNVSGPVEAALHRFGGGYGIRPDNDLVWLVRRGLLLPSGWNAGQMPREVALAVRGDDYRPELHLDPPPLRTSLLSREPAPDAATAMLDGVQRLVALLGATPAPTLAAGGVGIRELRRLAKELRASESEVRLWLELGAAADLLRIHDRELLPTRSADGWGAAPQGTRLATLLTGWLAYPAVPTEQVNADGKALPALNPPTLDRPSTEAGPALRSDLLTTLAEHGPAVAVTDIDGLLDLLVWRHPLRYPDAEALAPYLVATWTEAQRLGLVADGALTAIGRAVADGTSELADAAEEVLPAPQDRATFQPDLTAVVAGPPSAALAALLDEVADQESRDTASTWRLSPASVRRALDAGETADGLLARLAAVTDRPLPQPVEYLVRDAARRHGQLHVHPAGCCIVTVEPALAAEIAAQAKLRLRLLGPTVLVGEDAAEPTLKRLRAAGYSPVQRSASGQTVLERAPARRAPEARRRVAAPATPVDAAGLAARLSGTSTAEPSPDSKSEQLVLDSAPLLGAAQARLLAHAIDHGTPVSIDYINGTGGHTHRVIEPMDVFFDSLSAWCRLRQAERMFRLDRIRAVSPA